MLGHIFFTRYFTNIRNVKYALRMPQIRKKNGQHHQIGNYFSASDSINRNKCVYCCESIWYENSFQCFIIVKTFDTRLLFQSKIQNTKQLTNNTPFRLPCRTMHGINVTFFISFVRIVITTDQLNWEGFPINRHCMETFFGYCSISIFANICHARNWEAAIRTISVILSTLISFFFFFPTIS